MADEGFTPITGAEDNPSDSGFIDEANERSVDLLLLDPERRSVPVENDPAALDPLDDIGRRARLISEHPISVRVAEIHEEIQQILRLQRDICDGIELATDQVQDKRLEFLEAGPEVSVASLFLETALTFFLATPIMGQVVRRAFRFVGGTALASRAAKLQRLEAAAQRARGALADISKESRQNTLDLIRNRARLAGARTAGQRHAAVQEKLQLDAKREQIDARMTDLGRVIDQPEKVREQTNITAEKLKAFFNESNEGIAKDYGVALINTTVGAVKKAAGGASTTATDTDSFGVQIKSLAQFQLRNVEMCLGLAAADAEMLRAIAQSEPVLARDCLALLSEMRAELRQAKGKPHDALDARHSVKIEVEKLIWALLTPNEAPLTPEDIKGIREELRPAGELGAGGARGGQVFHRESQRDKPSTRLIEYWKARFFAGETLDNQQVAAKMRAVKADFLAKGGNEQLFETVLIRFKKDEPADD